MAKEANNKPSKSKAAANVGVMTLILGLLAGVAAAFGRGGSLEWVKSLLIAIGLALLIRWVLAEPFRIPSGSMEPTLHGDPRIFRGDRVFVNKLVLGLRWPLNDCRIPFTKTRLRYAAQRIWHRAGPQRWGIVVFKSAEPDAINTTLVKRVVGLPGERIHIADGKIYVNGKALEMPAELRFIHYISPTNPYTDMKYGILPDHEFSVVPKDSYLLLGDNSAYSRDGRYFGWVDNEHILGRVSCIWWPISRWRDFTGFSRTWWWGSIVGIVSALFILRLLFVRSWHLHRQDAEGRIKADHLYINRWAFGIPIPFTPYRLLKGRNPKRSELVMYRRKEHVKNEPSLLLGRVAGLPGERVFIDAGKLMIDGQPVSEFKGQGVATPCPQADPRSLPPSLAARDFPAIEGVGPYGRSKGKEHALVPEGHFFILTESDLPEDHLDSRTLGWIPHTDLVGSAPFTWWPPTRWRGSK